MVAAPGAFRALQYPNRGVILQQIQGGLVVTPGSARYTCVGHFNLRPDDYLRLNHVIRDSVSLETVSSNMV